MGERPDLSGTARYVICIRSPKDPKRKPRPKGGQADRTPHNTIGTWDIDDIADTIMDLLGDGKARTLNAIGIELWDKTADILSETKVEEALWQLVEAEFLWFTPRAPVFFKCDLP